MAPPARPTLALDRQHGTLQQQVRQLLSERITHGVYSAGDRLPTEKELAEEFGISLAPVRGALDQLASIGMIDRRPGSGTYVNDHPIPYRMESWISCTSELRRQGVAFTTDVIHYGTVALEEREISDVLRLDLNEVFSLKRVVRIDGRPGIYMTSYMAAEVGRHMPPVEYFAENGSLYAHLKLAGIELLFAQVAFGAHFMDDEEARLMETAFGSLSLEVEGLALGPAGPVEYSRLVYGNHHFRFTSTQAVRL